MFGTGLVYGLAWCMDWPTISLQKFAVLETANHYLPLRDPLGLTTAPYGAISHNAISWKGSEILD